MWLRWQVQRNARSTRGKQRVDWRRGTLELTQQRFEQQHVCEFKCGTSSHKCVVLHFVQQGEQGGLVVNLLLTLKGSLRCALLGLRRRE